MINLRDLTIEKTREILLKKEISCFRLVKEFFDYIEEKDKSIGAFLSLRKVEALEEANEIDKKIASNEEIGRLGGIPIAIKDNILIKKEISTAGSKILENYQATYDATVIKKLRKEGAVILGKTNLDEFAMGASTENSAYQTTKNPLDEKKVPGGSSGGSASAVASFQSVIALGSDTGGSVRQPASFCGLVGLRPTYGAVSRSGLISMASSLDQIGPLSRNVSDSAILFDIIRGRDENDQSSVDCPFDLKKVLGFSSDLKNYKIGIISECFEEKIDDDLKNSFDEIISILKSLGAKVENVSIKNIFSSVPCYYILMPSEVSANLARFDGLRYSPDNELAGNLSELYSKQRGGKFGKEVRRRIALGTFALSSGYYDAYYKKAKKVQQLIRNEFLDSFKRFDLLVLPTSPTTAFDIGEKSSDPLAMYLADIFTAPASIAGLPAISLPIFGKNALPYGFQIMANPLGEQKIFETAISLEKVLRK